MSASTTTNPAPSMRRESGLSFLEEVKRRQQLAVEKKERWLRERARYKAMYRHETLRQKVRRLAGKSWLDYDTIRREVEEYLPLANPTPARLRRWRECIARLVNRCRRVGRRGW